MAISALGSASGLPLEDLVRQLVSVERQSKVSRLDKTQRTLDASLSAYGRLSASLAKFNDAAKALSKDALAARAVTVTQPKTDKTFLEATASSTAAPSNFAVEVKKLALGTRLESTNGAFTSATDVVSATGGQMTFTAGAKSFVVDVTAGMTLDELRKKINSTSGNFGVTANMINAGGAMGTKLVFSSGVTGTANELSVAVSDPSLDKLSSSAPGGMTIKQNAQNAEITVDGITATSATNVFTNVVQDMTLTAKAQTATGESVGVKVATDTKAVEDKVKAFIDSYNTLVNDVGELTKFRSLGSDGKSVTGEGGALNGDSLARSVMSQIASAIGRPVASADPEANTLYALGITMKSDGKLEMSTNTSFGLPSGKSRFDKLLAEDFDAISRFFGNDDGMSKRLSQTIEQFTSSSGLISAKQTTIKSQISKVTKDREVFDRYIESYEQTLRKRYGKLDTTISQLQGTSSMLASQLASLPKISSN